MIEVRLFGDLRQHVAGSEPSAETVVHLPPHSEQTVGRVLARVGIAPAEISHVFLNGRLLPRALYPITLGYPLAAEQPLSMEGYLSTPVQDGDRIGIFPHNMGVVVV